MVGARSPRRRHFAFTLPLLRSMMHSSTSAKHRGERLISDAGRSHDWRILTPRRMSCLAHTASAAVKHRPTCRAIASRDGADIRSRLLHATPPPKPHSFSPLVGPCCQHYAGLLGFSQSPASPGLPRAEMPSRAHAVGLKKCRHLIPDTGFGATIGSFARGGGRCKHSPRRAMK